MASLGKKAREKRHALLPVRQKGQSRQNLLLLLTGFHFYWSTITRNDCSRNVLTPFDGSNFIQVFLYLFFFFFLAENQLSLTCHFRRGTIDPKDQSTYEFVHISGSSRLLSNDDGEFYLT